MTLAYLVLTDTTLTTITLPAGFSAPWSVECIGGGGGGSVNNGTYASLGGAGSQYAKLSSGDAGAPTLTAGESLFVSIGAGGAGGQYYDVFTGESGGETWISLYEGGIVTSFCGVIGGGGAGSASGEPGLPGTAPTTGCVGTVLYAGGSGGGTGTNHLGSAGGGGAAGPGGVGGDGGAVASHAGINGGSGGGGAGNTGGPGGDGSVAGVNNGAQGGSSGSGSPGGAGGTSGSIQGSPGVDGSGGGGGYAQNVVSGGGGQGGTGADSSWAAAGVYGPGGGGGGAAYNQAPGIGGNGGLYGGGGGGSSLEEGLSVAGNGAQGIIIITYTQLPVYTPFDLVDSPPPAQPKVLHHAGILGADTNIYQPLPSPPPIGKWGPLVVGDYRNGNLYFFNLDNQLDNGTQRKWLRTWRALKNPTTQPVRFAQLRIDMSHGIDVPEGTNPQVVLRWSDDGGHIWSTEWFRDAGPIGDTVRRVIFNRLGSTTRARGLDRIFELSSTDPFKVALIGAVLKD